VSATPAVAVTLQRRGHRSAAPSPSPRRQAPPTLDPWLNAQAINLRRHAAALGPLRREEFEAGAATVTEGHIQATNALIESLRRQLLAVTGEVGAATTQARRDRTTPSIQRLMVRKARGHDWVMAIERVWDFYFELFGQRQSQFADWLLSCDRIALDCYQGAYLNLAVPRSIPAPPAFSYMRTGFSPATFRRGLPLRRLGRQMNPFPLIQLPYHRLVNPWTLGAVLHEVSHNLHNDLGLDRAVPRAIGRRLLERGFPPEVASTWTRWNRETFADMAGLLLGGPAIVASLMDVVGRSPETVVAYDARGPHPTPYLRTFLSVELLRRMGFSGDAEQYRRAWTTLYPDPRGGTIPPALLRTAPDAIPLVVDTICYQPYPSLGNKPLASVLRFEPKEQQMIEEAAGRLAAGTDPGVVPERFLIGAARFALDHGLARPGVITERFYKELARR
jgi:hypothetical protein